MFSSWPVENYQEALNLVILLSITKLTQFQQNNLSCRHTNNKIKAYNEATMLPILMAVSCLSPVKTQTLMLASNRLAIVSGTP